MPDSLFSTYSGGENRVTSSILAVLRSLSISRCERILAALLEQSEFELVRFQNQPSKGNVGVPDAEISSSFRVLIETKIKRNALRLSQLKRHMNRFKGSEESIQRLLVLTPDGTQPVILDQIKDPRIGWASFTALDQAIDELLNDKDEIISEREAFILKELQGMLEEEHLICSSKDTLVIPGKNAWPEYQQFHAYVCQPRRSFQQVRYMAFYTKNQIHELVPYILDSHEFVKMKRGLHKGELGRLVDYLLDHHLRIEGKPYKVVFLTPPDDRRTVHLERPIPNDLQSSNGRTVAFTQNQRYVQLEELKKAKSTAHLVERDNSVK